MSLGHGAQTSDACAASVADEATAAAEICWVAVWHRAVSRGSAHLESMQMLSVSATASGWHVDISCGPAYIVLCSWAAVYVHLLGCDQSHARAPVGAQTQLRHRVVLCRIFADAAEDGNACVKVMRIPDGKRLSNARLKPKGDVFGEHPGFWRLERLCLFGCVACCGFCSSRGLSTQEFGVCVCM